MGHRRQSQDVPECVLQGSLAHPRGPAKVADVDTFARVRQDVVFGLSHDAGALLARPARAGGLVLVGRTERRPDTRVNNLVSLYS